MATSIFDNKILVLDFIMHSIRHLQFNILYLYINSSKANRGDEWHIWSDHSTQVKNLIEIHVELWTAHHLTIDLSFSNRKKNEDEQYDFKYKKTLLEID